MLEKLWLPDIVRQYREYGDTTIAVIGPGAVSVPTLGYADLLLDPYINCVVVKRPEFVNQVAPEIARGIGEAISEWPKQLKEQEIIFDVENCSDLSKKVQSSINNFIPRNSFPRSIQNTWDLWSQDSANMIDTLTKVFGCSLPRQLFRFGVTPYSGQGHYDNEIVSFVCARYGGGTKVLFFNGSSLSLELGEIGIWKGYAKEPNTNENMLINKGQALFHCTPSEPNSFPRIFESADMTDKIVPRELESAILPWDIPLFNLE